MKQLSIMMSLILIGLIVLSSSKPIDKSDSQKIKKQHEEGYYDLIGQDALEHL